MPRLPALIALALKAEERKQIADTDAIAMSGLGSLRHTQRSAACGFRHHLVKPLNTERLNAVLAEAAREIPPAPT